MIRYCVDCSEQRHHLAVLAGTSSRALAAALTRRMVDLDWIRRINQRRAGVLTDTGRQGLIDAVSLDEDWEHYDAREPLGP